MALALTLVIVAAEIDLSVASVLALSSALMASLWNAGLPLELIMPICLVVGALCGAFNGLLVTRLGLPSLAVTIGTLALFRGLAYVVIGDESVTDFPAYWTDRGVRQLRRARSSRTRSCCSRCWRSRSRVLLHATPFGRSIYAIGANEEAAYFSGLRVKRIKLILFIVLGHGRRARGHRHLAAQLDRRRQRRPWVRADRDHRRPARRRVDLRRPRHDRRGHPRAVPARRHPEGAAAQRLHLVVLDPDRDRRLLVGSVLGPNIARRVGEARRRRASHTKEEGS